MTHPSTEIWLFHPKGQGGNKQFKRVEAECKQRGWKLSRRHTKRISSSEGRVFRVVDLQDATNLYRRIHRSRVGVWQIGNAQVVISPELTHIRKRVVTLKSFVMHKAFHCTVPKGKFLCSWLSSCDNFDEWTNRIDCEGEGDPRCLPLHVFESALDLSILTSKEGRSVFDECHGPQSKRIDARQVCWRRPLGSYHGRDVLSIAGRSLVQGFHWDVSTLRKSQRIVTTSEIWEIKRGGYVNVYPDEYVRKGNLSRLILPKRKRKAR